MGKQLNINPNWNPNQPQSGNNGSPQHDTGVNPVGSGDTTIWSNDFGPANTQTTGSPLDWLKDYASKGKFEWKDEEFQNLFSYLWSQYAAEQSENWARQDSYTDWQRSLESADYNAKLGLETAQAGRSQLYNQLIAMGMSPAAAMQAAASFTGASATSGGAAASHTNSAAAAAQGAAGGESYLDRLNAGVNAASSAFSVALGVGNLANNARSITQQNAQFYDQLHNDREKFDQSLAYQKEVLAWQKESFGRLNYLGIGLANARNTDGYVQFSSQLRDLIDEGKLNGDDLVSSVAGIRKIRTLAQNGDSSAAAVLELYNAGKKEHGSYWTTNMDSDWNSLTSSVSDQANINALVAQTSRDNAVARLNNKQVELTDEQINALKMDNRFNKETIDLKIQEAQLELQYFIDDYSARQEPAVKYNRLEALRNNEAIKYYRSAIDAVILSEEKSGVISGNYNELIAIRKNLDLLGINAAQAVGSASGAAAAGGSVIKNVTQAVGTFF